jgi:hypothetical protein
MSRGRLLLLIAATAFALRLAVRLPRGGADLLASGYTFYLDMATSVLRGTGFCLLNGGFCASRMPGYPLVLTPFVWAGWTFPALVFLQAAVGATLVYAAWMLGAALFNGRIGMIAAAMAAISPYAVVHDTALQDTVFLNVLTAFGVAMLLDGGWRSAGCPRYAGAGLSLSLAVLTSARIAFVLISKMYRQMYANTGIATDSARVQRSTRWARWLGHACRRLFLGKPMPDLAMPGEQLEPAVNHP